MITTLLAFIVCSWTLPKIVPRPHWLRYYLYYGTAFTYTFIYSLLFIPAIVLLPWKLIKSCSVVVAQMVSKVIGIEWLSRNENIWKSHGQGIIVANHQTMFDVMGLIVLCPHLGEAVAVTKKEISYFWPIGLLCSLAGCIFIDRSNPGSAVTSLNLAAEAHFKRYHDARIVIFPEGTRNHSYEILLPFKKGAFRLAIDHHLPIFPLVYSPYYFINDGSFRNGKVMISFLEPILVENNDNIETLMERTRNAMQIEINRLRIEFNPERTDTVND